MSILDEISKERQRVREALARVDTQREKLTSQLRELEATERVLARYRKAPPARKTASDRSLGHGNKCSCFSAIRRAHAQQDEEISRRQAQLAEHK